jgi:hypothetical protein
VCRVDALRGEPRVTARTSLETRGGRDDVSGEDLTVVHGKGARHGLGDPQARSGRYRVKLLGGVERRRISTPLVAAVGCAR